MQKITLIDWVVFALQRELDGEIAMLDGTNEDYDDYCFKLLDEESDIRYTTLGDLLLNFDKIW